uniref:Uncharacterized protein n=1 Tax=Heterorhabditis bacteriophora TaxID=37862 RepID=A0A1I7X4N7_HETBA
MFLNSENAVLQNQILFPLNTITEDPDCPSGSNLVPEGMNRKISGCYLNELKLMDLGPMPRDQAVLEEEREKEQEKKAALI